MLLVSTVSVLAIASLSGAQALTVGTPSPQQSAGNTGYIGSLPAPIVTSTVPANGQVNVNPNIQEIRINFNQPMDVATFYWPIQTTDPNLPLLLRDPYWTNGNRTLVLPVKLTPVMRYSIPLNVTNVTFRNTVGAPLQPGYLRFQTSSGGSAAPMRMFGGKELPAGANAALGASSGSGVPSNTLGRSLVPNTAPAATVGNNSAALTKRSNTANQTSINKAKQLRNKQATPTPTPNP